MSGVRHAMGCWTIAGLLGVLAVVFAAGAKWKMYQTCKRQTVSDGLLMREIISAIPAYRADHGGRYPASLDVLAAECAKRGMKMEMMHADQWSGVLYVANLQENDPKDMPLLMSTPESKASGLMLCRESDRVVLYRDLADAAIRQIVEHPCVTVEQSFSNGNDFLELCKRVKVMRGSSVYVLPPEIRP